jgi:hypothetical protein
MESEMKKLTKAQQNSVRLYAMANKDAWLAEYNTAKYDDAVFLKVIFADELGIDVLDHEREIYNKVLNEVADEVAA